MSTTGELFRALGFLCEAPGPQHPHVAELLGVEAALEPVAHTDLFVLQCPPYAALYLGSEGMLGGDGADQVAGFWRAIGFSPPSEPDHVAALLGLYASLREAADSGGPETSLRATHAAQVLLAEHLVSWVPVFVDVVARAAAALGAEGYRRWALLLDEALVGEASGLEASASLPRALRVAPGLPDMAEDLDVHVGALLAPVRSGLVLSRLDLLRAGREVGVPGRVGERRFALVSMLKAAPVEVLSWLCAEAHSWEGRHLARVPRYGEAARWWASRAASTALHLDQLAQSLTREVAAPGGRVARAARVGLSA